MRFTLERRTDDLLQTGKSFPRALQFVAATLLALPATSPANTCVALKRLRVPQVCGHVRSLTGAVMSNATVNLTTRGRPETVEETTTDSSGNFGFSHIEKGEYQILVTSEGYAAALRDLEVGRPKEEQNCVRAISVTLGVGSCGSSVGYEKSK
jgi:hypothetical protein